MPNTPTTLTLNDGTTLPAIGFGTYPLKGEDGIEAMVSALENGYRHLDTAVNYENEAEVGESLRRSGVPRDEVVVACMLEEVPQRVSRVGVGAGVSSEIALLVEQRTGRAAASTEEVLRERLERALDVRVDQPLRLEERVGRPGGGA